MLAIEISLFLAFFLGSIVALLFVMIFKKLFLNQVSSFFKNIQKLEDAHNDLFEKLTKNITEVREIKFFMMRQKEELDTFSDVLEVKFGKIAESMHKAFEMRHYYENEIIKLKKIIERKEKKERGNDSN